MAYVSVNAIDHYYEWIVSSETPEDQLPGSKQPVMVFVHGWGGSSRYWETTARALADDFDCLLYDMRGFGRSAAPSAIVMKQSPSLSAMESFAEDLRGLIDALDLGRVYINAHSLGGSVVLYFLERYPNRVEQAILTCNGSFEYQRLAFAAFHQAGSYVVALRPRWLSRLPLVPHVFMARFLKRDIPYSEKLAFLEDYLSADGPTSLGTLKTAVSEHATIAMPRAFAALQVQTLMVSGEYDQITPAKLGRRAAELSDQIEFVLIEDTGHFPMLEDPQTYLRAVRQFLRPTQLVSA